MKIHKKLSTYEAQILDCLSALELTEITVPFSISGSTLEMEKGEQICWEDIAIVPFYHSCLEKLYTYKNMVFSPGVYAFYGTERPARAGESYALYLTDQIQELKNRIRLIQDAELAALAFRAEAALNKGLAFCHDLLGAISRFELLHGDLHLGNIIKYEGSYRLIDFEYARFGPRVCELAFLLCWDYIVGIRKSENITALSEELHQLRQAGILNSGDEKLICRVFIPLFAILAAVSVCDGAYQDTPAVRKGLADFVPAYLSFFQRSEAGND